MQDRSQSSDVQRTATPTLLHGSVRHADDRTQGAAGPAEAHPLRLLQRAAGNQAVQRLAATSGPLRAKLRISAPDDEFEQEADRVAASLTGEATASIGERSVPAAVRRSSQGAPAGAGNLPHITPHQEGAITSLRGGGSPLPDNVRRDFEPRFGENFGGVRVHTGDHAGSLASSLDARAFTVGNDIVFGPGQFTPETNEGRRLLAHELTHVVQNSAGGASSHDRVQRDPANQQNAPAPTPVPAGNKTDDKAKEDEAKKKAAIDKAKDEQLIVDLIAGIYQDLRYEKGFTDDERKKLKLHGTESASYFGLFSAATLPIGGAGGLKYGPDGFTSLSTFNKYLDAVAPLTPSLTLKTDLISRMIGMRIDEYLATKQFEKRLIENKQTLLLLLWLAQIGWSTKSEAIEPTPDMGGLVDERWKAHLGLIIPLVGLIAKEKLTPPTVFDVGPLLTPSHPYFANDTFFGGNLPSGLNVDHAKGPGGNGEYVNAMGALNFAKIAGADTGPEYRGWQASLFGGYQYMQPTPTLADQGRVPDRRFKVGALVGSKGVFTLGEVGAHFSGPEAKDLTSMFVTTGLAYMPPEGDTVKKVGFKVSRIEWKAGDSLAPRDATGAPEAGSATRVTPFADIAFSPSPGHTVGLGGTVGATFPSDLKGPSFTDFRGDISYTYLGLTGTQHLPAFRVEFAASGSQVDYFKQSPMLYGVRGKMQISSMFYGAQVNWGADKIPADRAAQMGDPRTEGPANITPAGNSVLIVIGTTQ